MHDRLHKHIAHATRKDGSVDLDSLLPAIDADYAEFDSRRRTALGDKDVILRAFDDARIAFSLYSRDERLVLCNDYARHLLFDFNPELPRAGMTFAEICEAYARHHLGAQGDDAVRARVELRLWSFRNPSGTVERPLADGRWVMSTERRTQNGGIVTINVDITDRKKAEDALRASEARLRAIIEHAPMGIGLATIADHRILYANPQMARVFGYKRNEMIGLSTDVLYMGPDEASRVRKTIQQSPAGRSFEIEFRRNDGTPFWGRTSISVVTYDGQPCNIIAFYDSTTQRTSQRLLQESEARLRSILANVPDAVFTLDLNGTIQSFNPAAERLFGYTADEIRGLSFILLMPEDVKGVQSENLRRYRERSEARYVDQGPRRVVAQHKSGRTLALEIAMGALKDSFGTTLVAVARDVSERERTENELRAAKQKADLANGAKSEFIANVSHELRTPLNAILGFSDIIRKQLIGPDMIDRYAEYAEDIHSSGSHLLDIINDILDLSKVEAGQATLEESEVEISSAVLSCLRLISERATKAGIRLSTDIAPDLPLLVADLRKLKQIIINLLSNAVKFTPADGEVNIRARHTVDGMEIIVKDTGIGMAEDEIPRALLPFTQLDSSLARKYEGTGLGLPLAKALTELHGGFMQITSAPGQGAAVRIVLPPSRVKSDPTAQPPLEPGESLGQGLETDPWARHRN